MLRVNRYSKAIAYIKTILFYRHYFLSIGKMSIIESPMLFSDTKSVCIGEHTYIAHFSWLMGDKKSDESTLKIGNNVQIGHFAHIVGKYSVTIMDSVLIADRVYISDCDHNFDNTDIPILEQGIHHIGNVVIGEGSWIGENVCVSGSKIVYKKLTKDEKTVLTVTVIKSILFLILDFFTNLII